MNFVNTQQNSHSMCLYPQHVFPDVLNNAINHIQCETQASIELIASSMLSVMSLACQDVFDVSPSEQLRFPVSLYQIILAESGERKSTVDRILMKSIRDLEKRLEAEYCDKKTEFQRVNSVWKIEHSALEKALKAEIIKNGNKDAILKRLHACLEAQPIQPVRKALLINDATRAAVKQILSLGEASVGLFSDESGSVLRGDLIRDTPLLNSLWSGSTIKIDRANSDSLIIEDSRLGLMLMVQPGLFKDYVKKQGAEARSSGFFARTLICQPRSNIGSRFNVDNDKWVAVTKFKEQNQAALNWFQNRVLEFFEMGSARRNSGTKRVCLTFSPEAKQLWINEYNKVEGESGNWGALRNHKDYASKQLEHISRISGVLEGFTNDSTVVSRKSMEAAIKIANWYFNSFMALMNELPDDVIDANLLYAWLASNLHKTTHDCYPKNIIIKYGPNSLRNRERLSRAISSLYEQGRICIFMQGRKTFIRYLRVF